MDIQSIPWPHWPCPSDNAILTNKIVAIKAVTTTANELRCQKIPRDTSTKNNLIKQLYS